MQEHAQTNEKTILQAIQKQMLATFQRHWLREANHYRHAISRGNDIQDVRKMHAQQAKSSFEIPHELLYQGRHFWKC